MQRPGVNTEVLPRPQIETPLHSEMRSVSRVNITPPPTAKSHKSFPCLTLLTMTREVMRKRQDLFQLGSE